MKWEDELPLVTYGYYKNHKPYCGDEVGDNIGECRVRGEGGGPFTRLTCNTIQADPTQDECELLDLDAVCGDYGNHFGNSTRACEEGYFQYSHNYSCGSGETEFLEPVSSIENPNMHARLLSMGLQEETLVCVFKPKVQVLDNWGWCNGSCSGSGNSGCYSAAPGPGGVTIDECDKDAEKGWTKYPGEIIVIPND